ncbi:MAG: PD40 domain-containing protein [Chitinophagaceae bacterium]|nr:PD40 domain-containing protein [Chitinophagaceae bacterium]
MKGVVLFWLSIFLYSISPAQNSATWLRYPAISPDGRTIAFIWHGDLYTVPANGGTAKLLVKHDAQELMPVWNHNSTAIAFASNRSGNFDLFIVPAKGGDVTQLTWHAADEFPSDFSPDDKDIIFSAARMDAPACRQFPSESLPELYQIPASGGRIKQLLTTPAEDAKISRDGNLILYHDRKARENPWRKHQTSSAARDIWAYNTKTGKHIQLSSFEGEDRSPVFAKDPQQFFFLSERSGSFNVFQSSLSDTSIIKQISFFKDHPVRSLTIATDNTLCFGYDGAIWTQRANTAPRKVKISMPPVPMQTEKNIPLTELSEMAVSPSGQELAFIARGEVFVCDIQGNAIKQITKTAEREAGLSFAPDGKRLIYASERNGKWKIFQASVVGTDPFFHTSGKIEEVELIGGKEDNYQPAWSPDGKEIAFIANRNTLSIFNCASGKIRTILTGDQLVSRRDRDQYFEWSPDGQWLLVQFTEQGGGNDEAGIVSTSGNGKLINLTRSGFNETRPRWMMDGKMILYASDRFGLHSFDNSSTTQTDMFALFTDGATWRQFNEKGTTDTLEARPAKNDMPDWQNIADTKQRLTTISSLLEDALVSRDGKTLYYLAKMEKNYDLWQTDLQTKETKRTLQLRLRDGVMQWDKDQKLIYILADGVIHCADPGSATAEKLEIKTNITVDPVKERAYMFDHVWRRTAQTFYTAGFHGANWNRLGEDYRKYLAGIDNNFDFAEMLNELLGELNISHTGATFNYKQKGTTDPGTLGIFYDQQYAGPGMKIDELVKGSPLERSGHTFTHGDIILSIDGQSIAANRDIDHYLINKAGKKILLQIKSGEQIHTINVTALSADEEADLLYKRWVERNRLETEQRTNGEWGYVHLYRMNDAAYRTVYEEVLGKYHHCKGIIVDTRFNRGGDLAPELVTFLSGKQLRTNGNDQFQTGIEPSFRWTRPSIVLAGEANYSDGHCFVYDYQYLHMGKLIGMPVPGSCTWMTGQSLLDPSLSYSVPTMGVKTNAGKYLENYQTEPDIRCRNEYGEVSKGRDQQLEEAIRQSKLSPDDR